MGDQPDTFTNKGPNMDTVQNKPISLEDKRKEKSAEKTGTPKAKKGKEKKQLSLLAGQIQTNLMNYILRGECGAGMVAKHRTPNLPNLRYHKQGTLTQVLLVDEVTQTCKQLDPEMYEGLIGHFLRSMFAYEGFDFNVYNLESNAITRLCNRMKREASYYTERWLEEAPAPIGFKSTKGLCFKRFDFDPAESATPEDFPTIALTTQHMTNARCFYERVGSLYDPDASLKQMLYFLGEGDGGKTTIMNLLTMLAGGPDYVGTIGHHTFTSFGFASLINKRVWIAEELDPKLVQDKKWKLLTGGGVVNINPKFKDEYCTTLNGMIFATSNHVPEFTDDSGIKNRTIICEIDPIPEDLRLLPAEVKKRMLAELPYFIKYCQNAYAQVNKNGVLQADNSTFDAIVEDADMEQEFIFDQYFQEDITALDDDGAKVKSSDFFAVLDKVDAEHPNFFRAGNTKKHFENYVKRRLNLKRLSRRIQRKDKQGRYILGLAIKGRR